MGALAFLLLCLAIYGLIYALAGPKAADAYRLVMSAGFLVFFGTITGGLYIIYAGIRWVLKKMKVEKAFRQTVAAVENAKAKSGVDKSKFNDLLQEKQDKSTGDLVNEELAHVEHLARAEENHKKRRIGFGAKT